MIKKDTCVKCKQEYNRCLECFQCKDLVCYNCALCLADPSEDFDMFFCKMDCLMMHTEDEYAHGNGD